MHETMHGFLNSDSYFKHARIYLATIAESKNTKGNAAKHAAPSMKQMAMAYMFSAKFFHDGVGVSAAWGS